MTDKVYKTACTFGFDEELERLEKDLLSVKYVQSVDFDIDGFYDNINYIITIFKYAIPVTLKNYFEVRRTMLKEVLVIMGKHGLSKTGDAIEDYGEHYYIVRSYNPDNNAE